MAIPSMRAPQDQRVIRSSEMPAPRVLILITLVIVCALVPLFLGVDRWQRCQVSRMTTAAEKGTPAQVAALLAANPKLADAPGYHRRRPLWWAAAAGHTEVMTTLLKAHANLNAADDQGWTPLHAAAAHNRLEAVKLLVRARAKLGAVDLLGRNALHAAATGPNMTTAEYLLELGYSPNGTDNAGWTSLHVAVMADQLEMAKFLLDNKANINAATRANITPLKLAHTVNARDEIITLLSDAGGME